MCFLRGAGKPHARPGVTALSPESTTTDGPNGNQNHLWGLWTVGAGASAAPLLRRPHQRHLRGAPEPLPAVLLHPRAPRAGGRARGDRLRFPGNVSLPQEEAPEQEDPARAGGIRTRQSQPRARRGERRALEAVRHRPAGEMRRERAARRCEERRCGQRSGTRPPGAAADSWCRLLVQLQGMRLWNKQEKQ